MDKDAGKELLDHTNYNQSALASEFDMLDILDTASRRNFLHQKKLILADFIFSKKLGFP